MRRRWGAVTYEAWCRKLADRPRARIRRAQRRAAALDRAPVRGLYPFSGAKVEIVQEVKPAARGKRRVVVTLLRSHGSPPTVILQIEKEVTSHVRIEMNRQRLLVRRWAESFDLRVVPCSQPVRTDGGPASEFDLAVDAWLRSNREGPQPRIEDYFDAPEDLDEGDAAEGGADGESRGATA